MSDKNINTDPPKPEPEPKIEPSNIEKYNEKKKVDAENTKIEEDKAKDEKLDAFLQEAIDARKVHAPLYVLNLIENLDPQSQLEVLKAHDSREADPNTSSIGTPIGRVVEGLEKYMTYNQTNDKLSYDIPASVLMNPKKNKELLGID